MERSGCIATAPFSFALNEVSAIAVERTNRVRHAGDMVHDSEYQFGAIILAAGSSRRMGRPKLLLPWGGTTVLGHLIESWVQLGASQVAVVISETDRLMDMELNRLKVPFGNRILNSNPERGMFSSIQCATRWEGWKAGIQHWAIVLGDQPHLQIEATLQKLMEFAKNCRTQICQPGWKGKARHPVILPEQIFKQLANSESESLKEFLLSVSAKIELLELDDPGLDMDMDHPADYDRVLRHFFSRHIQPND